jgi:alpha,alpha-trehalase
MAQAHIPPIPGPLPCGPMNLHFVLRDSGHRWSPAILSVALAATLAACVATARRADTPPAAAPVTPDLAYPELFDAVQMRPVFPDQKTFADARPLRDPAQIRADYLAQRGAPDFDLRQFVARDFALPDAAHTTHLEPGPNLREHIDRLWPVLTRRDPPALPGDSLLVLPQPYVVPGGRFREMYYWDSYFTMLGLVESGEHERSRQMLANFAFLVDRYGHIPNGTRSYYLSRSQPPFFSHMVELEARVEGDTLLVRYLPQLRREHAWWMQGEQSLQPGQATRRVVRLDDGSVLNRYWDDRDTPRPEAWLHDVRTAANVPQRAAAEVYRDLRAGAESGWDYSSRWLDDPHRLGSIRTSAIVPVDLNSLLHHLESVIAKACRKAADASCVEEFDARASRRKAAIEQHLWNADGYYTDYDWQRRTPRTQVTAATLYPLYTGIASPQRAHRTAMTVRARLLRPGGLATTTVRTGEQWDAPNAWAPLQWVAIEGLDRYGEDALAHDIAEGFLRRVEDVFRRERRLVEKYDAEGDQGIGGGGEYALQDGFGWTNGVVRALLVKYPRMRMATVQPAAERAAGSAAPTQR